MASVTALQLVNRVMLNRRQPTITDISTVNGEHQVVLNAVNMAKNDILESKQWDFDTRKTQLVLRGRIAGDVNSSGGDASLLAFTQTAANAKASDWIDDYVCRLLPSGNTDYGDTGIRVDSIYTPVSNPVVVVNAAFTQGLAEPQTTGTNGYMFRAEYMLPETVRTVIRVTYQQGDVRLLQVDPTMKYEELFPRPSWEFGEPEVVAVGGWDVPTYDIGSGANTPPAPKLRLAVFPVPDTEYILDYSYTYRHPELTTSTDTLVGVPEAVVSQIVWHATGIASMAWDQNYAASHFSDMAQVSAHALHRTQTGGGGRHTIRSMAGGSSAVHIPRGFPNEDIG